MVFFSDWLNFLEAVLETTGVLESRFFAHLYRWLFLTGLTITFFFLEMVYPHHRAVFKRATVEDPEWILHLPPDATGIIEALEDSLRFYQSFEFTFGKIKAL